MIDFQHEILRGIDSVPPIDGFVLTSKKENPLVDVILTSPEPSTKENATVLAAWTYGAGRTAVFTTDAGKRWANLWTEWDGYDQFFAAVALPDIVLVRCDHTERHLNSNCLFGSFSHTADNADKSIIAWRGIN